MLASGCLLATLAGAVNAIFVLQLGTSVSHLTGDGARVVTALFLDHDGQLAGNLLLALGGFLLGAILAGFGLHHPALGQVRLYRLPILGIGLILLGAALLERLSSGLSIALAACAMGLQNALASRFRGVILRTTHVTGLLTDLGVYVGMRLKGHQIPGWKMAIPLSISLSFFAGAIFGALGFMLAGFSAVLLLGVAYLGLGLSWQNTPTGA